MKLAVCLAALLVSATAIADNADDEIARAHFATGVSYYDSSRFGPAVAEFLDAYRLSHRPAFLYNIARAYEKLGDPGRASHYYRKYLDVAPSAVEGQQIMAALVAFQPRVGTLAVRTAISGAEILVDDETIGLAPVDDQLLTAGAHVIELRPPGAAPRKIAATVVANTTTRIDLDQPDAPARPSVALPLLPPPATPDIPRRPRWLWPVIGAAAALVVAGVVTGLLLAFAGTDYTAAGRQSCSGSGCLLLTPGM